MKTMKLTLPETAFSALRKAPDEFVHAMRVEAATQWYARGEISQDKGAEIAGVSRAEFIDELASRRITVDQVTLDELKKEVQGG